MNARKITGEVSVWLTKHSSIGPKELAEGDGNALVRGLQFTVHNMTPEWTKIGTATVTITLESSDAIVANQVKALRAEQTKVRADAERRSTEIERQIQTLLAIAYTPEAV